MSSIDEIIQRIAVANSESKRINEERNINIGKKETLTKQLTTAIDKYKNDYGVEISADNLNDEINRVTSIKEEEIKNIESVLSLIQEGKYVDAENIVTGNTVTTEQTSANIEASTAQTTVEPVVAPSVPASPVVPSEPTIPVAPSAPASPVIPSEPASPVSSVTPSAPASPVSPVAPSEPASPMTPQPVNTSGIAALNNFSAPQQEAPVAPSVSTEPASPFSDSTPTAPTSNVENVTSFSAILGGSNFQV